MGKNLAVRYHNIVKRALIEVGNELVKEGSRFRKVIDGDKVPIRILHPTKRKPVAITYKPDVYYQTKVERKFIFEVIDTESENEIITDITLAFLSPRSHVIIFIAPTEEKIKRIFDLMDVIYFKLTEDLGAEDKQLPYREVWKVPRGTPESVKRNVRKFLKPYLHPRVVLSPHFR